jgi:hypothetical protein
MSKPQNSGKGTRVDDQLFALIANREATCFTEINEVRQDHVQRVSAKHGVKDDLAFLWEYAIFRHPPNKNPLTDRFEILHS